MKAVRGVLAVALLMATIAVMAGSLTPIEHRRGPEQTYLTFPEWFLVFSPAEYASYTQSEQPSGFPFWGHVRQFWSSYAAVTRATTNDKYVFNGGYHVMILVIGVSTTVEYAIRGAYETVVGRLAELAAGERTAEDVYAARVAQEYVDFIRVRPWYEFDFASKLTGLWRDIPASGSGILRKWERRYALTNEYLVKAIYGWLIGIGTHASYETPLTVTSVVLDTPQGKALQLLPRYEAFTPAATKLANDGMRFDEVAGNDLNADILISVLAQEGWAKPTYARELFRQPIITQAGRRRVALVVSVGRLADALRDLTGPGVAIEHVFDY